MKKVQDLVHSLNTRYDLNCSYKETDKGIIIEGNSYQLIYFTKKGWDILDGFCRLFYTVQKYIMDFAYDTTPNDWFPKKKYNIIIANCTDGAKTYWKKDMNDFITFTTQDDKSKSIDFIFTESEIKKLESTLPVNMAEIIELGKVEVKDEH